MRNRLLVLLLGLLLAPLSGPVAAADPGLAATPGSDRPSQAARDRAGSALDRAESLFDKRPPAAARRREAASGRDATMVLNRLVRVMGDLAPADRERARALLARPTVASDRDTGEYAVAEEEPVCGEHVCVHWVSDEDDAPKDEDEDGELLDTVERVLQEAESIHAVYITAGYLPPDPDSAGADGEHVAKLDVYLADLEGAYGYAVPEPASGGAPYNRSAYVVIDNDFAGFSRPWLQVAQVTLAHEYFHAVQFAYDAFEDFWFMEATATWAEDELFDGINDNRQYLPAGQLRRPWVPLDRFSGNGEQYGNWIFFRYLTERWTASQAGLPTIVREMWRKSSAREGARDMHSTKAVQSALARRNTSFTKVFGQFTEANRRPVKTYDEGGSPAYRADRPARTWSLRSSKRRTGNQYTKLDHLASSTFRYRPGKGTRQRDWRLRVRVDPPALRTAPVVRVTVYMRNGRITSSTVRLRKRGASTKTLPFSSRRVKYVELVLANASRRTNCWQATNWACQGMPRDNNERTDFSAQIFRR